VRLTGTSRPIAALLTLVAVALHATPCDVPNDAAPNPIPTNQVPARLLNPSPPTSTVTTETGGVTEPVYFIDPNGFLVATNRVFRPPGSLEAVLDTLLLGPSVSESAMNITTAIPNGVQLYSASYSKGLATVNFNPAFGFIVGHPQVLAVSQVVYTVAHLEGLTTRVAFQLGGVPVEVPIGTGVQTSRPVTVADYPMPASS